MLSLFICTEVKNWKKKEETSKMFRLFINRMVGLSPPQFQGVHMNDIPVVEGLLHLDNLLYEIDILDGKLIGEFARRSVQKYGNNVRVWRYNNYICYESKINAVFQSFGCSNCDTFFNRTSNLERHLTSCGERVIQKTFIKYGKYFMTRCTLLELNTRKRKHYSRN